MRETFSEEGFGEGGKAGTVPTREQMAGTAKEEGLRSFCFVVASNAGSAHVCPKQQACKFTGSCCFSHGGPGLRLCPSEGLSPLHDLI